MPIRSLLSTALLTLALASLGCAGGSPTTEPAPANEAAASFDGSSTTLAAATFRLTVDPANASASFAPVEQPRSVQQSELYNLSIANFSRPGTLHVDGVEIDGTQLVIHYGATHPFPKAGNLAGPATAGNREDLAVTARVLFLLEGNDEFFNGSVTTNTAVVANADGYFQPGQLIADPPINANTFPYKLVVDETLDNRVGLPNGGSSTGNYNAGSGGWQVPEFTAGITGYEIWGQGQTASNTLRLNIPALAGSPLTFDTVIVVKYEDPRGGATPLEKRANRLPQGDPLKFAYRMPHGALDVGAIEYRGETGGLIVNSPSSTTLTVGVRDWDARATEAAQTNLALETNTSLVSAGESGLPRVEVSIPVVLGQAGTVELPVVDNGETGLPGDELVYEGLVGNALTSGQPPNGGPMVGLLRVTDIVDINPPSEWENINRFNLTPDLTPFGPVSEGITYQRLTVALDPVATPFDCVSPSPGMVAPEITQPFDIGGRITKNTYETPPHANWNQFTFKALDTAASIDPSWPGIILQGKALMVATNTDFYRFEPVSPTSFNAERLTDFTATPQDQAFDIEVDENNRIFFLAMGPPYVTQSTPGLIHSRANADIRYFDYTGTMVTTPPTHIVTGPPGDLPSVPLAMTLDPLGNVYTIDRAHRLHMFDASNNYAEIDDATYPISLPFGAPMGGPGDTLTRNVHDFVIDYRNAAFFILTQSNEMPAAAGQGNGFLYRIDCDGNFVSTTPQGNPNPMRLILNEGFQNNGTADITIDQYTATGAVLANAMDVQMVVVSHTGFGNTAPDMRIISSELTFVASAALDFQDGSISDPAFAPGTATMDPLLNQLVVQPDMCDACYHWYPAPSGWQ